MSLNPLELLEKFEAENPAAPVVANDNAEAPAAAAGEGEALKKFLAETGVTLKEVYAAVDVYLDAIPDAVSGDGGSTRAFNVARILRYGFDLGEAGAWRVFQEWNRLKCNPPFDEEMEGGPNSLRRKYNDAGRLTHTTQPRGYLLYSNDRLRRIRESKAAAVPEASSGTPWDLGAIPLSEFYAEKYPRPEMLVGPFMKGAICFLYGSAGSLKTWLAMEVMRQSADAGHPCLYVLEEGMPFVMQQRLANLNVSGELVHLAMRNKFDLVDPKKLDALIEYAKGMKAALIVLDPFSDCSSADENERSEMLVVRKAFDRIVKETGACLLVIHHSNKAGGRQGKADLGADMANMRGSSVLMGAVDMMLELRRSEDTGGNGADVFMTKNRNFGMQFPGTVNLVKDEHDRIVEVRWVHGEDARQQFEQKKAAKEQKKVAKKMDDAALDRALWSVVSANPGMSKSKLVEQIVRVNSKSNYSPSTIDRRVRDLVATKNLKNVGTATSWSLVIGKPLPTEESVAAEEESEP